MVNTSIGNLAKLGEIGQKLAKIQLKKVTLDW